MARNTWHRMPPQKADMAAEHAATLTPQHISKQEFGRRLYSLMIRKGWNQSELARRSKMGRDSISTYVRGVSFPDPRNLQALCDALGCKPEELLPNIMESAMDREHPAMEIKMAHGEPGKVWLRVNRMVPTEVATKIFSMVNEADREEGLAPEGH